MLQEQNYFQPLQVSKKAAPFMLIDHIDNQNYKLKQLINSFRERGHHSDDSFNNSSAYKQEGTSNRSFRLQQSRGFIRKQIFPFPDYSISKTQRIGDFKLPNKKNLSSFKNSPAKQEAYLGKKSQPELVKLKKSRFRIKNNPHLNIQRQQRSYQEAFQVQSINTYLIASHLQSVSLLSFEANPQQIFAFFQSIYQIAKFPSPLSPIIKRYKNCIYYGSKSSESQNYKGMVWYFKKSLYYGQMMNGRKNGLGIQIKLKDSVTVWKGKFENGQKTGYFSIQSPNNKYYGHLKNGQYHGQGHLITRSSQYKGNFCEGLKEGYGWQKFPNKSEYKGEYFNSKYDGNGEIKAQNYYFKGLFKYGKPDGHGFQRTSQYEYLGNFLMGVKEGKGKIKTKDGTNIQGIFRKGLLIEDFQNPESPKQLVLQKNLSKELHALNQQSQEGTIENMLNRFRQK